MASPRKFDFDRSFDPPGFRDGRRIPPVVAPPPMPEPEPEPEEPPPPPAPTFSQEELDAARHQGWVEGRAAGEADAMERTERRLADAVERLTYELNGLSSAQSAALERIERQAAEVALTMVKKLFPALTERAGTAEIEALIADGLSLARDEPKLAVLCAPDMMATVEPILATAAAKSGFEGRLAVRADESFGQSDCRIEWTAGGLDRDASRLMDEIESAVARGLADFDRRFGSVGREEVRP